MKTLEEIKTILIENHTKLKEQYAVSYLGLFGSIVRNENNSKSDIDILVDFDNDRYPGFFDFINLENFLKKILKSKKIDLVIKSTLRKRIGTHIMSEVVEI